MFYIEIFIRKGCAVNGYRTSSVTIDEVTSLDHERVGRSVEDRALVAHWTTVGTFKFSCTELTEVLNCPAYKRWIIEGFTLALDLRKVQISCGLAGHRLLICRRIRPGSSMSTLTCSLLSVCSSSWLMSVDARCLTL